MRPHGRARVNSSAPEAQGVCDSCGMWYSLNDLQFQNEYAATHLYNTGSLRCSQCLDEPFEQNRAIILPPDPMGVLNARTEPFAVDEAGPVSSQIAVNAAKGATTIFVADVSGFAVTNHVLVQMNNAAFAAVTITGINTLANSMNISIPLPYAASTLGIVTVSSS